MTPLDAQRWRQIADLWRELAEHPACEAHGLETLLGRRLGEMVSARSGFFVISARGAPPTPQDPLAGWRVPEMIYVDADEERIRLGHEFARSGQAVVDPLVQAHLHRAGQPRALLRPDLVDERTWSTSPSRELYSASGVRDRLTAVLPIRSDLEFFVVLDRPTGESAFAERERRLLEVILSGLLPSAHRILRSRGHLDARRPLTPREREVLQQLLTGRSEKQIASYLELKRGTVHEHITRIYAKFGVQSRVELMSLWLNGDPYAG